MKKRLLNTVDSMSEDIIEFLRALIRFRSVTGDEGEIQAFIARKAGAIGLQ